jgi:hypothetical protein
MIIIIMGVAFPPNSPTEAGGGHCHWSGCMADHERGQSILGYVQSTKNIHYSNIKEFSIQYILVYQSVY